MEDHILLVAKWKGAYEDIAMPFYVDFPLTLKKITVDRVIDLRDPATAKWFVQTITRLQFEWEEGKIFDQCPIKGPLDKFEDLIPTILDQRLGGSWNFCMAAEFYLRTCEANGLIYPSARNNPSVEIRNKKIVKSHGWNFVDYSNSEGPQYRPLIDVDSTWHKKVGYYADLGDDPKNIIIYNDVTVKYTSRGPTAGSWSVNNISRWQEAWYQTMMVQQVLEFRDVNLFRKVWPSILLFLSMQETAEKRYEVAYNILMALMGVPESLETIHGWVDPLNENGIFQIATALNEIIRMRLLICKKI